MLSQGHRGLYTQYGAGTPKKLVKISLLFQQVHDIKYNSFFSLPAYQAPPSRNLRRLGSYFDMLLGQLNKSTKKKKFENADYTGLFSGYLRRNEWVIKDKDIYITGRIINDRNVYARSSIKCSTTFGFRITL